ncbi:MAG: PEP-CTERM sorting domain-containing protein [Pirellulales bacterium]|nr:PEP-CTERM sorting domain-containing protein [Pirellulales bacterium]
MRSSTIIACFTLAFLAATISQASPIVIYNTGVDDSGVPLADNAIDPHWTLSGVGAAAGQGPNAIVATQAGGWPVDVGVWMVDNGTSTWLVPSENTYGPGATDGTAIYTFSTEFTTPGDGQVTFVGVQSADNGVVAFDVDGVPGTFTPVGFNAFADFSITASVTGTSHTLNFAVHNGTGEVNPDGPIGFRAEFTTAEFIPEPASLALLAIGGLALLFRRRW